MTIEARDEMSDHEPDLETSAVSCASGSDADAVQETTATEPAPSHSDIGDLAIVVFDSAEAADPNWPTMAEPGDAICEVFQTRDLLATWARTIGDARGSTLKFVRVAEPGASGRVLLLCAFAIEMQRGVTTLGFPDGEVCDYHGPILFDWTPAWSRDEFQRLMARMLEALPAVDVINLEKLTATIQGRPNPMTLLETEGWSCSGHEATLCEDAETFFEGCKKVRRSVRKRQKRLFSEHAVSFDSFSALRDAESTRAALDELFRQKRRRFRETRMPLFMDHENREGFYRELTMQPDTARSIRLAGIVVDGEHMIGFQWAIPFLGRYYYLVSSFAAEDWAQYSPGRLINQMMLEWIHSDAEIQKDNLKIVDFGIGDEGYKYEFNTRDLPLFRHRRAVSAKGRRYLATKKAIEKIRATPWFEKIRPYKWILIEELEKRGLKRKSVD